MDSLVRQTLIGVFVALLPASTFGEARGGGERLQFADVSEAAGVRASHRAIWDPEGRGEGYLGVGQAWGDYDNDGLLDLYVTGNRDVSVLYRNQGDGTFAVSPFATQVSLPGGMSGGAVWADYDNDGWRDLYVLSAGADVMFKNDAGRGFRDVTKAAGLGDTGKGESATWGDYDGDGYLDLYVVNWSCLPECNPENVALSRDRLYRNNADGTFTDVTNLLAEEKTLGSGFAASFGDYDGDGDPDLFVVNDKMANPIGNVMWRNDGPGCGGWCFTDVSEVTGTDAVLHSMGVASGDYDNDGDLDVYVSNMMSPMMLLENTGLGVFTDVTQGAGVGVNPPDTAAVGWGTAFFDADNDGLLDLYLASSGTPSRPPGLYGGTAPNMEDFHRPYPDVLFRNNGDGTFSDVSEALAANDKPTMGLAYADYDNDGDVDFVQGNWNEGYRLYQNRNNGGHNWLSVQLVGSGSVNRDAVGARVYVMDGGGRTQMREVGAGSSLGAGHDPRLHFGLGGSDIARLTVVWPNGLKQTFRDPPTNRFWRLTYQNGADDAGVATDWYALAGRLVRDTPGFTPPVASRAFGYLGVTLYEAVVPGMAGYQSLTGQLNGLELPPQPEAADLHGPTVANSALATIARHLFGPAKGENAASVEALEATYARRFRAELGADVFRRSVAWGARVAEAVYAWSLTDGGHEGYAQDTTAYRPPDAPGMWVSTPPTFGAALHPTWGDNRPFVAGDGCPVVPPLAYSEDPASAFYAEALEVYRTVGALSPERRDIALFWADNPLETATPPGHWLSILTRLLREGGYELDRAAEAYAKLGVALADSFIACWHDKYQYNVPRPISYIQKVIDPAWNIPEVTDPVVTPPFPEYPSGHSVQSAAAAAVLTATFGPVPFTDHTHQMRGLAPRRFSSFWDAAEEAAVSRLYGGIHFRAAIEEGLAQGRCIGERVNALRFRGE